VAGVVDRDEPESQQSLLDVATSATASQLDRIVAGWRRAHAHASGDVGSEQRRYARLRPTDAGMVRLTAQLGPEEALVVQQALDLANSPAGDSTATAASESGNSPAGEFETELVDALVAVARGYLAAKPTTRGTGCELIMMTTPEQLHEGPHGVGGFLRDGTPLPLHVARLLACDGHRVDVRVGASGDILDVGRARRTIPTAIGRALALRDGGCRVPGCGRSRHLQAHHVHAWAEGGATSVDNLVLLCPGHHWLVHEGQMRVAVNDGKLEFVNAHGLAIEASPHHGVRPPDRVLRLDSRRGGRPAAVPQPDARDAFQAAGISPATSIRRIFPDASRGITSARYSTGSTSANRQQPKIV
jgi:hypothetical protein